MSGMRKDWDPGDVDILLDLPHFLCSRASRLSSLGLSFPSCQMVTIPALHIHNTASCIKWKRSGLTGGSVVKHPPASGRDRGSGSGPGKSPDAAEQLPSLCSRARSRTREELQWKPRAPQLESSPWLLQQKNGHSSKEPARPKINKFNDLKNKAAQFSPVQLLSRIWLFAARWTAAYQASLSITNSRTLLKLTSIESVMPSNHLSLCRPLLLSPSIFPSIRVFSNESVLHIRWPKYWSFSFSISPSNEYSGLISFRMDWLDLPSAQATLKTLVQQHSSKASILRCSAFSTVQLSHPSMTTGKLWLDGPLLAK